MRSIAENARQPAVDISPGRVYFNIAAVRLRNRAFHRIDDPAAYISNASPETYTDSLYGKVSLFIASLNPLRRS